MQQDNQIIVTFNDKLRHPFSRTLLAKLRYFADKLDQQVIDVQTRFSVDSSHTYALENILNSRQMTPYIDMYSFKQLYTVVKLATYFGMTIDVLMQSFNGFTDHPNWHRLHDHEYVYACYDLFEDLVDFKKFFRLANKPLKSLQTAIRAPVYTDNPLLYLGLITYYKTFDFNTCFNENNDEVQKKVELLTKQRNDLSELFLVKPYEYLEPYLRLAPSNEDVWSCEDISVVQKGEYGTPAVVDAATLKQRFSEFTLGVFDKSPNPNAKPFPFANVAFAGGSIAKLVSTNYNEKNAKQSDIDMFIFASSYAERSRVFEEVLDWFKSVDSEGRSETYYAIIGSVVSVYIKNKARKFQIISINSSTPFDVINHFDMTHIQWCIVDGVLQATPEACLTLCNKVTRFNNTGRVKIERLIKALHCGYSIHKDKDVIAKYIDITNLIEDPDSQQLKRCVRGLYGYYYPYSQPAMDFEEEKQYHLCMIEKDSNATLVTDDPKFVLNNITIGGNFENDYESILFSTFNPAVVITGVAGNRVPKVTIKSKQGIIRLTTPIFKTQKVAVSDEGIVISVRVEDEFREFCRVLETQVFRMIRNGAVSKHILTDENILTFKIPKYRLTAQQTRGVSCFRSQRGAPLNIEEDLVEGDDIQALFIINIVNDDDGDKYVELSPVKFVKYQKHTVETAVVEDDLEKEIAALASEEVEIKYED